MPESLRGACVTRVEFESTRYEIKLSLHFEPNPAGDLSNVLTLSLDNVQSCCETVDLVAATSRVASPTSVLVNRPDGTGELVGLAAEDMVGKILECGESCTLLDGQQLCDIKYVNYTHPELNAGIGVNQTACIIMEFESGLRLHVYAYNDHNGYYYHQFSIAHGEVLLDQVSL